MTRISVIVSAIAIAVLTLPAGSLAQSGGGGAGGGSAGELQAVHRLVRPAALPARQKPARRERAPPASAACHPVPANAGGLNNSINDPSGAGNSGKVVSEPPSGTNNLGTANSSETSVTTGSAGNRALSGEARPSSSAHCIF